MDNEIDTFCKMIRNRSKENREAMHCFSTVHGVLSPAFSILRQELDSMIRVIYLLAITDVLERERLVGLTLRGEKWKVQTANRKLRVVTDLDMVDLAQGLQGWTKSVYHFGCAFMHLSDFHNHLAQDPFARLSKADRDDVLSHMRNYHGGPQCDDPDIQELSTYIPRVFDKIADNLECYVKQLERGGTEKP